MLARTTRRLLRGARPRVPVVDAEALANDPRRAEDEADIRALLATVDALDVRRLRDYYRLFGRARELDRSLEEARKG